MRVTISKSGLMGVVFLCAAVVVRAQDLLPAKQGEKWGYIDTSGQTVIPFNYDYASSKINNFYTAKNGNTLNIIFSKNKILTFENAKAFQYLTPNNYKILLDKKWYLTNANGVVLHDTGYDYIQVVKSNDTMFVVQNLNKKGIMTGSGKLMIPPKFSLIRGLYADLFSVKIQNQNEIIINSLGKTIGKDTFKSIYLLDLKRRLFIGNKGHDLKSIFDTSGRIYYEGKKIQAYVFSNKFLCVEEVGKKHYFDLDSNSKPLPEFTGTVINSSITDYYQFENDSNNRYLYNTKKGIIAKGKKLVIESIHHFRILHIANWTSNKTKNKNYTEEWSQLILDSNYQSYSDTVLKRLLNAGPNRILYFKDTGKGAIYNVNTNNFETPFIYSFVNADTNFIKAYLGDGRMHLFDIDKNGTLANKIEFENAVYVAVDNKDKEFAEIENWNQQRLTINVNVPAGRRSSGWYSINKNFTGRFGISTQPIYGLIIQKDNKNDTVIRPVFNSVKVLDTAPYSIAVFDNNEPSNAFSIGKIMSCQFEKKYLVVNDLTGERLTAPMSWIDEEELIDPKSTNFRAFHLNTFFLISKTDKKILQRGLYISKATKNGTRRIYTKGVWNFNGYNLLTVPENEINMSDAFFYNVRRNVNFTTGQITLTCSGYKWMICNEQGTLNSITGRDADMTYLSEFVHGKAIFKINKGKFGAIDSLGNIIIKPEYDMIKREPTQPDYFICGNLLNRYGVVSNTGELLTQAVYNRINQRGDVLTGMIKDSVYLINFSGETNLLGKNARIVNFKDGYGFVKEKKGYKIIDDKNNTISDELFKTVLPFNNGHAAVRTGLFWGVVDATGKTVLESKYKAAVKIGYTSAILKKSKKAGFVGYDGDKIKKPKYFEAYNEISEGIYTYVNKQGRYRMCDSEGKKINKRKSTEAPILFRDMIITRSQKTAYFYDRQGTLINTLPMNPGNNLKKEFILEQARTIRPKQNNNYCNAQFSPAQLFAFDQVGPFDFIYTNLPVRNFDNKSYGHYSAFVNDVYSNSLNTWSGNMYNIIHSDLSSVFNLNFSYCEPFFNNKSICAINKKFGLLEINGYWNIPAQFDQLTRVNDSVYIYKLDYQWQVLNSEGEILNNEKADFVKIENGIIQFSLPQKVNYYNINSRKMIYGL